MERVEGQATRNGGGEDRLSTALALALIGANLAGVGMFALLKALHVPPLVASTQAGDNSVMARSPIDPPRPNYPGDPSLARSGLLNLGRAHR